MIEGDFETVLAHYGVKGMRWGVVKTDPTTLSKEQRKEAKANFNKFSAQVVEKKYATGFLSRPMSDAEYKKLGTKDLVLNKNQAVRRVTRREDEKFNGGITYVSYKKQDVETYRAVMPLVSSVFARAGSKQYKQSYEATYRATERLKSPSEKARVDGFVELFDNPSVKLKNGKTITGRQLLERTGYKYEVKGLTAQQIGQKFYKNFTELQYKDTPLNTAYYESMRKKGYNAVVDDNDRGHLSNTPLILLNPDGTLKRMNVKPLTADQINNAQRNLKID